MIAALVQGIAALAAPVALGRRSAFAWLVSAQMTINVARLALEPHMGSASARVASRALAAGLPGLALGAALAAVSLRKTGLAVAAIAWLAVAAYLAPGPSCDASTIYPAFHGVAVFGAGAIVIIGAFKAASLLEVGLAAMLAAMDFAVLFVEPAALHLVGSLCYGTLAAILIAIAVSRRVRAA